MKYRVTESGKGKMWCGDEVIILSDTLSQAKLKKLFKANCTYIEQYEQEETTSEETETSSSTAEEDKSNGSGKRKANRRKTTEKRTDD